MNNFLSGAASLQKANPKTHRLLAKFSVFVLTTNTSPAPHPPQSTITHSLYGPPNFSQILVNVFVLLLQLYFITLHFLIRINHSCCFSPASFYFKLFITQSDFIAVFMAGLRKKRGVISSFQNHVWNVSLSLLMACIPPGSVQVLTSVSWPCCSWMWDTELSHCTTLQIPWAHPTAIPIVAADICSSCRRLDGISKPLSSGLCYSHDHLPPPLA